MTRRKSRPHEWLMLVLMAIALSFFILGAFQASDARAVTGAQAANIAYWESADICPRHSGGVCISRRSDVLYGLGGGAWAASAEGWERGWWEPWITSRASARWYSYEIFHISPGGSVYNRRMSG